MKTPTLPHNSRAGVHYSRYNVRVAVGHRAAGCKQEPLGAQQFAYSNGVLGVRKPGEAKLQFPQHGVERLPVRQLQPLGAGQLGCHQVGHLEVLRFVWQPEPTDRQANGVRGSDGRGGHDRRLSRRLAAQPR